MGHLAKYRYTNNLGIQYNMNKRLPVVLDEGVVVSSIGLTTVYNHTHQLIVDLVGLGDGDCHVGGIGRGGQLHATVLHQHLVLLLLTQCLSPRHAF